PARGILAQQGHDRAPVWALPEASEGFQERQIGLPGPILVHALARGYPHVRHGGNVGHTDRDQRRLAHAGFAGNEPELPLSPARGGPPLLHLGHGRLPPDEVRGVAEERERHPARSGPRGWLIRTRQDLDGGRTRCTVGDHHPSWGRLAVAGGLPWSRRRWEVTVTGCRGVDRHRSNEAIAPS